MNIPFWEANHANCFSIVLHMQTFGCPLWGVTLVCAIGRNCLELWVAVVNKLNFERL